VALKIATRSPPRKESMLARISHMRGERPITPEKRRCNLRPSFTATYLSRFVHPCRETRSGQSSRLPVLSAVWRASLPMTLGARALASVTMRAARSSRSSSCSATRASRPLSDTSGASSGSERRQRSNRPGARSECSSDAARLIADPAVRVDTGLLRRLSHASKHSEESCRSRMPTCAT
jgi:hypothetical protein